MPGVSLIIPCCNQSAFVAAAIQSALAQSVPPDEVILIDDGSTDASAAECARFGDAVRIVRQDNRGAAAARNAGVALSHHPLLAFLDADDLWPADSLAHRLALIASGADIAFGAVRQFGPGRRGPPSAGRLAGAMLIRRAAFDRVGPFDDSLRSAEVIDWVARADFLGCVSAGTPATVLHRRIHGANMMLVEEGTAARQLSVLRAQVARKRLGRPS